MNFEPDAVCEKIINEIDVVLNKDPDLCDFEIIHVASNQNKNKSPVLHVDNNLGLESWCIQHVYEYAHRRILANKHENSKLFNCTSTVKYLNFAILINPDVATFWNIRRQLFVKNRLNITKEFQFSSIVLSKKPKSNEAFFYRRWLFLFRSGESIDWTFELGLCERCADKNASNYHAWCHRLWVLQKAPYLFKYELRITEKFIRKHIGDYSGYNHRQYVMAKLLEIGYVEDDIDYTSLIKLIARLTNEDVESVNDLIEICLSDTMTYDLNSNATKSILYCLNIAANDLEFCAELNEMFGYREAFNCHRKAVLKFIVDICTGNTKSAMRTNSVDGLVDHQPQNKMSKIDQRKSSKFLNALRLVEGERGQLHRKWCEIFLGFEYTGDISTD